MAHDTRAAAERASSYIPDDRVLHFWDLWKFGSRTYAAKLRIPESEAWDLFVFFRPHVSWKESAPEPTFWMQARGLTHGEDYSRQTLTSRLETWLK